MRHRTEAAALRCLKSWEGDRVSGPLSGCDSLLHLSTFSKKNLGYFSSWNEDM